MKADQTKLTQHKINETISQIKSNKTQIISLNDLTPPQWWHSRLQHSSPCSDHLQSVVLLFGVKCLESAADLCQGQSAEESSSWPPRLQQPIWTCEQQRLPGLPLRITDPNWFSVVISRSWWHSGWRHSGSVWIRSLSPWQLARFLSATWASVVAVVNSQHGRLRVWILHECVYMHYNHHYHCYVFTLEGFGSEFGTIIN